MKTQSILTDYNNVCAICGKPATAEHHLIFGNALRKLAEEDGVKIPICDTCHTKSIMIISRIHDNTTAEHLSKMLGQMAWERHYIAQGVEEVSKTAGLGYTAKDIEDEARDRFRRRYGRSYL